MNIDAGFGCHLLDIRHNIFSHRPTIGAPWRKHTQNANPETEIRRQHTCAACLWTAAVMLPAFDCQRSTRRSPEQFQWCICERRQPEPLCEQGGIIGTKKICRFSLKKSTDSKLVDLEKLPKPDHLDQHIAWEHKFDGAYARGGNPNSNENQEAILFNLITNSSTNSKLVDA